MQIKERRTKILLAFFLLSDITEVDGSFSFSEVVVNKAFENLFDLAINPKTTTTLSSLLADGLFVQSGDENSGGYKLTEKGLLTLSLQFPYVRFVTSKWDNKWRILSYEIPEKKRDLRDRLRREVSGWGLGPWHRSFWLTPHPIIDNLKALVKGSEEEQYIQAFEADHAFGDTDVLIEKVWGKSTLDKKYRELFKKWHDILAHDAEKVDKLKKVISEYVEVLRQDPGLPKELIGEKWIGYEAFNIFKEIRGILLS